VNKVPEKFSMKELRARNDMTQEQAAHALGISAQTYNAWEKNPSVISIGKFYKVAELFGVKVQDIFLPGM
jgi:putative transcriptional regulator